MRKIKTNQSTRNPTKDKNDHGKELDNGCLRYFHYHPKRKPTVRTIKLNLHA